MGYREGLRQVRVEYAPVSWHPPRECRCPRSCTPRRVEQLLARGFHRAVAIDVHVQGRRGNAEALREVLGIGVT